MLVLLAPRPLTLVGGDRAIFDRTLQIYALAGVTVETQ
jgi:hypothetical protein